MAKCKYRVSTIYNTKSAVRYLAKTRKGRVAL